MESHPLRMRGLKPRFFLQRDYRGTVASFTDAWIETISTRLNIMVYLCRILYGCVD